MKTKKNVNKLTLKKETISNLNQREMTKVQGGHSTLPECVTTYDETCTCYGTCYSANTCNDSAAYTCPLEHFPTPLPETECC